MASRNPFTPGVPVLCGESTVAHVHGAPVRSFNAHMVVDSAYRSGGFAFLDMPKASVVRLEGPALPPTMLEERMTRAVLAK